MILLILKLCRSSESDQLVIGYKTVDRWKLSSTNQWTFWSNIRNIASTWIKLLFKRKLVKGSIHIFKYKDKSNILYDYWTVFNAEIFFNVILWIHLNSDQVYRNVSISTSIATYSFTLTCCLDDESFWWIERENDVFWFWTHTQTIVLCHLLLW